MPNRDDLSYCAVGQDGIFHDRSAGRLLVLNSTARRVWELASAGKDAAAIAEALCTAYGGVNRAQAEQDTLQCLQELRVLGLIV